MIMSSKMTFLPFHISLATLLSGTVYAALLHNAAFRRRHKDGQQAPEVIK
jgi:hypothetical protein